MKKSAKTPQSTTGKKRPRKIMIFDFYEDVIEMKQKPISMMGIERLAKDLLIYAFKDEDATKVRPFFNQRGIGGDDVKRWRGRSEHFDRAYRLSLAIIGDRREHGALTRKYAENTVLRSMHHYDDDWKAIDKFKADLTKVSEQDQKTTTFNVNMTSYKKEEDDEETKAGDGS